MFPESKMKTTFEILKVMIEVISLGGNFLLNVAPTAAGKLTEPDMERLKEIGAFMEVNGEAIYETRPALVQKHAISADLQARFTWNSKTDIIYLFLINLKDPQNTNLNNNQSVEIHIDPFLQPVSKEVPTSVEVLATKEQVKHNVEPYIQFCLGRDILDQHEILVFKLCGFSQKQDCPTM